MSLATTRFAVGLHSNYYFDNNGNLVLATDSARPSNTWQYYVYDEAGELTQEHTADGAELYNYDAYGNLTRLGSRSYDFGGADPHRVTCVRDLGSTEPCGTSAASSPVTYDLRGNVQQRGQLSFTHDLFNRLTKVSSGGAIVEQTTYDGTGSVATHTRNGTRAIHLADWFEQYPSYYVVHVPLGRQRLASIRFEGFAGSLVLALNSAPPSDPILSNASARARGVVWSAMLASLFALVVIARRREQMAHGLALTLASMRGRRQWLSSRWRRTVALTAVAVLSALLPTLNAPVAYADPAPPTTTYYHSDLVDSATLLTDDSGSVVRRSDYRPYGELRSEWSAPSQGHIHHGFQAGVRSEAADVSRMGARHYDAELGRFLEADDRQPSIDNPHQLNRYMYAGGNPVNIRDPSGHGWLDILHTAFTSLLTAITGALLLISGVALVVAITLTIVVALWISGAIAAVASVASGFDRRYQLSFKRILTVGFVVGAMVALNVLVAGIFAASPIVAANELMKDAFIDFSAELVVNAVGSAVRGNVRPGTDGDAGLGEWAFLYVLTNVLSMGSDAALGSAETSNAINLGRTMSRDAARLHAHSAIHRAHDLRTVIRTIAVYGLNAWHQTLHH